MPICTLCRNDKPDDDFKVADKKTGRRSKECRDCALVARARRYGAKDMDQVIAAPQRLVGSAKDRLNQAMEVRMKIYQESALEALFDLALMPIEGCNSATLQVKYLAACRLAGPPAEGGNGQTTIGAIDGVLKELNDRYHRNAPRIREVRERITTFEDDSISVPSLPQ